MRGYSLSDLLVGKYYQSTSKSWKNGIIKEAVRREDCLDADFVFAVRVRNQNTLEDFWTTVWIATEE